MRKLFSLNFDLSSHLFCLNTLSWPGHCDLLPSMSDCFAFNSLPFICLDPHWPLWLSCWHLLGSVLSAPFLGCPAHSCWLSLVQSLASCTPACSMVSATLSILLTCSPSFISSHLAFHCLSLDIPLSSWWYEPSPTLPPKHLFLIPSQFLPALSHLDTQRVVVQSLAHPMCPDYAQNLRLQTFEEI